MDQTIETHKTNAILGVSCALGAVIIWASWMAITRLGVTTSLSAQDVTMLRFGIAGLLLSPVILRKGFGIKKLGLFRFLVLVCGAGAPYSLVASSGLIYAPAAHAGILIPGVMPLFVAILAMLIFQEKFTKQRLMGYGLILGGLLVIAGIGSMTYQASYFVGHMLMLSASLMWACYTIALRQSQLDALHAAAIVTVSSMILFTPFYFFMNGFNIIHLPMTDIAIQAGFQGIVATIFALYLFGKAISLLGAPLAASFGALVPVLAALIAIPILGEWPSILEWTGIGIVTGGVYLASRAKTKH